MSDEKRISIADIAREAGASTDVAREILNEVPGRQHAKDVQDRVFKAARKLGYDLRKLKIGKRMDVRRETYEEILKCALEHPAWGRTEIVGDLERKLGLVKRVQRKTFPEEFGD